MEIIQKTIRLKVPNISNLDEIWSSEDYIYGIPWQIKVKKKILNAEPSLGVFLHCTKKNVSADWTQVASATIELLSFGDNVNPVVHNLEPFIFDNSRIGSGIFSLIKWCDLFDDTKNYVKNDAIILDVKIMPENPSEEKKSRMIFEISYKCCEKNGLAEFRLVVTNIEDLMVVRSPRFIYRNVDWYFIVYKDSSNHLGLYLSQKSAPENFSCELNMAIKLVSTKPEKRPIEKNRTKNIGYNMYFVMNNLVSWEELLKTENCFVQNNSITIEVKLNDDVSSGAIANGTKRNATNTSSEAKTFKMECGICSQSFGNKDVSFTPCGHMFCLDCIVDAVSRCNECPSCKSTLTLNQVTKIK